MAQNNSKNSAQSKVKAVKGKLPLKKKRPVEQVEAKAQVPLEDLESTIPLAQQTVIPVDPELAEQRAPLYEAVVAEFAAQRASTGHDQFLSNYVVELASLATETTVDSSSSASGAEASAGAAAAAPAVSPLPMAMGVAGVSAVNSEDATKPTVPRIDLSVSNLANIVSADSLSISLAQLSQLLLELPAGLTGSAADVIA